MDVKNFLHPESNARGGPGHYKKTRRYIDQKVKVVDNHVYHVQNLQNMAKSKKIITTSDRVALKSSAIEYEKQRRRNIEENNRVLQQLGIPLITATLGGNNELARRQSRRASEEDGDYMPLEDEGPDNAAAAATKASTIRTRATTKASKSRTTVDTRTIRTTATSRRANDVMLSSGLLSNRATNLTFSRPYTGSFNAYFSETKILIFFSAQI
ncbi:hypothetical protein Cgig2_012580 [Carnegiea gigantea]|uniref:Uncharacterized protein n=1 Tax=Carnegiea gigantea TaxID=171969 RepID=A0A9Q1K2S1_9CARY|nr:hypothetical protein Cgig2_012580 [Carnegiea gigantea]